MYEFILMPSHLQSRHDINSMCFLAVMINYGNYILCNT